jgi:CubicO group peptidase (beta-lactamase class C family)
MTRLLFASLLLLANTCFAQEPVAAIMRSEAGSRFSGTGLLAQQGQVLAQVHQGYANRQFAVPMADTTRLPIASVTKLFTAILVLQMCEKSQLRLTDNVGRYLPNLPVNCRNITLLQLLTHYSGLKNEPTQAYASPYTPAELIQKFVARKEGPSAPAFNYNNLDYIVLTRVLEVVAQKSYAVLLQESILNPLEMSHSGLVSEARIIPGLAYGYHNYSFGAGKPNRPLTNDSPIYLSTYSGAGAIYSTAADLLKLVQALRDNRLLSPKTTALLTTPQQSGFVDYARGTPALAFYCNDKTFSQTVLERRGSINGFNSVLLTDKAFHKVVVLLANTDAADLEVLGDQLYAELK